MLTLKKEGFKLNDRLDVIYLTYVKISNICYGGVAEWSKAPDLGSGLSRRGFEPHLRQTFYTCRGPGPLRGKRTSQAAMGGLARCACVGFPFCWLIV